MSGVEYQGPVVVFGGDADKLKKAAKEGDQAVINFAKSASANMAGFKTAGEKSFDSLQGRVAKLASELKGNGATAKLRELEMAVEKIGGTSKLTGAQVDNLKHRIDSLVASGAKLPPALKGLTGGKGLGDIVKGEAVGQMQGLTQNAGALGSVLTKIGPAGLAAGAGVGAILLAGRGLAQAASDAASYGARITDMATALGTTTEGAQRLEHAARVSGTDVGVMTAALVKMRGEIETAPEKFTRIGLSIKELKALSPEDQFKRVGDAIAGIQDDELQTAVATDMLGKSWKELAPLMTGGLSAMKDANPISDETIKALNDTKTAMNVLAAEWEKLWVSIGAAVVGGKNAPEVINNIASAVGKLSEIIRTNAKWLEMYARFSVGIATTGASEGIIAAIKGFGSAPAAAPFQRNATMAGSPDGMFGTGSPLTAGPWKTDATPTQVGESEEQRKKREASEKTAAEAAKKAAEAVRGWAMAVSDLGREQSLASGLSDRWSQNEQRIHNEAANAIEDFRKRYVESNGAITASDMKAATAAVHSLEDRKIALNEYEQAKAEVEKESAARDAVLEQRFQDAKKKYTRDEDAKTMGMKFWSRDPKIRAELEKTQGHLYAVTQQTEKWSSVLSRTADIFQILGNNAKGALGAIAAAAGAIPAVASAIEGLKLKGGDGGFSLTGGAGAKGLLSNLSGALSVAAVAVDLGKKLAGALSRSLDEKVADEVGASWGAKISDATTKSIIDTMQKLHLGKQMAELLNIGKIMADAGGDPAQFTNKINDLFNAVKLGAVPAKEGVEALGETFADLKKAADGGSVASEAAMVQMIKRSKQLGLSIPEIDDAVQSMLQDAVGNLKVLLSSMGAVGKNGEFKPGANAAQSAANSQILGAVFGAESAKVGVVQATQEMKESIEALLASLPSGEKLTGPAAQAAEMLDLLNDQGFKAAAEGGAAAGKVLKDLADSANLSQEALDAFGTTGKTLFDQAFAGAKNKGLSDEDARKAAERANLPLLTQMQHAEAMGLTLSPDAEAMLKQAQEDGILPMLSISEQQLAVLKQIRDGKTGEDSTTTPPPSSGGGDGSGGGADPGGHPTGGGGPDSHQNGFMAGLVARGSQGVPSSAGGHSAMSHRSTAGGRARAGGGGVTVSVGGITVVSQHADPRQVAQQVGDVLYRNVAPRLRSAIKDIGDGSL